MVIVMSEVLRARFPMSWPGIQYTKSPYFFPYVDAASQGDTPAPSPAYRTKVATPWTTGIDGISKHGASESDPGGLPGSPEGR